VIRGRVTRLDGLPLARSTVTAMAPQTVLGQTSTGHRSVQTDGDGQYEFGDLPAGQYRITAAKVAYTTTSYGQRTHHQGTPIDLAEGQTHTRIDIVLPQYSTLTGRILDEYGDPVEHVAVNISQITFQDGRRRLTGITGVAGCETDDVGRYRVYGLPPGQYIVSAASGQVTPFRLGQLTPIQPGPDLSGYATTYFPGTTNAGAAKLVLVRQSQDLTGLDFALAPAPTVTISGKRIGSDGQPLGGSLRLVQSQRSGAIVTSAAGARTYGDGRFEFPNVAPGDYVIQADLGKSDTGVEGDFVSQFVTVNGNDVPDVLLEATPGSTISGRVVFDGDGTPPPGRALTIVPSRADLDRTPLSGGSIAPGDVRQDLTFVMTGIHGPRRLALDRRPPDWDLKSVIANGVDVTDAALSFGRPDQSLADVEFTPIDNQISKLRTDRETSQPNRQALEYWSTGLEPVYIEGAFERAHLVT
jgi:hypothetical protein